MAITSISTDWGIYPRIVRIVTNDNYRTITTPGYLLTQDDDIRALQNGEFEWTPNDFVAISYFGGKGLFNVDYTTNFNFTALSAVQNASFTLSSANILAMYATPIQLLPAAGVHTWIVLMSPIAVEYDFGTTQYTGGTNFGLQYGNAAHLAGTAASSTEAAATIDAFVADNGFILTSAATGLMSTMVNEGIYASVSGSTFAAGDGTMTIHLEYAVYDTTA